MEFKDELRQTRKDNGWTLTECAERTQIPYRTLQNWERGERDAPDYVKRLVIEEIKRQGNK